MPRRCGGTRGGPVALTFNELGPMPLGAAMPDGYGGFDKKGGRMRFIGTPTLLKPNYTGPVDRIARGFDRTGKDWNHPAPTTSASR